MADLIKLAMVKLDAAPSGTNTKLLLQKRRRYAERIGLTKLRALLVTASAASPRHVRTSALADLLHFQERVLMLRIPHDERAFPFFIALDKFKPVKRRVCVYK